MGTLSCVVTVVLFGACGDGRSSQAEPDAGADAEVDASAPTGPRMFAPLLSFTDALHAMTYANGFVYAVHSSADAVEVFDATTRAHVTTIAVGHVPGDLATDGTRVYVANMTARDAGDPYLSVISTTTQTVVDSATVRELHWGTDPNNYPWTNFPTNVTIVGQRAYVVFPTNAVPGLVPVDAGSLVEATYQPAGSGPASLAGVGDRLVVTNLKAIGNFTDDEVRIERDDGTLLQTIPTGGKLHDARTVGDRVWIAHAPTGGVPGELLVIDPATATMASVATAAGVYGVATAGGLVYVTCTDANRVQVFDATTHALVEDLDLTTLAPTIVNARGITVNARGDIFLESDGMLSALYR